MTTAHPEEFRRRFSPLALLAAARHNVRWALAHPMTNYYMLLGASGLLLTIGLIMVLSASSVRSYVYLDDSYAIVKKQLTWVALGLPAAWIASRMPLSWIRALAWPAYGLAIVLLGLTVFMGESRNGNQNWLAVGPVAIQPSEIAKLALVLWAAHVFAMKERKLDVYRHLFIPVVPGMGIATALVLMGRDLGTTLVFIALALGMLWVVGAPMRLFGGGVVLAGALVAVMAYIDQERLSRITNFSDPFKEYHDAGWQPAHGLFALATGDLFGQGIGGSTQKWGDLPEAHTDFIFAVLGEELGLAGTLLVVSLFLVIAFAALRVATAAEDPFVRYLTFGIVVWLVGQMMINIGMVLAVLPVIGIPLPLISYGGSALLPSLVALGLVIGFARTEARTTTVVPAGLDPDLPEVTHPRPGPGVTVPD